MSPNKLWFVCPLLSFFFSDLALISLGLQGRHLGHEHPVKIRIRMAAFILPTSTSLGRESILVAAQGLCYCHLNLRGTITFYILFVRGVLLCQESVGGVDLSDILSNRFLCGRCQRNCEQ
jgi:hypothetical protein